MTEPTHADSITPFIINKADIRGRVVRLGRVADTILARYPYPPAVAHILGELLVVAAMLGSNLKQEGIFTLQLRGQGPVPLLVVDASFGGQLRGYAEINEDQRASLETLSAGAPLAAVFGANAHLAITLDPGVGMQRYQGVVAVEGDTITDALAHYFTHSQQVDVLFRLAVDKKTLPGASAAHWLAGGLMIERLPPENAGKAAEEADDEGWRYASAIAATVKGEELLDPLLDAHSLLYRLYHEEGVWVEEPAGVNAGCRCSRERIVNLLTSMPLTDRAEMVVDGEVSVHCQFCNTTERFTPNEIGLSVN